VVPDAVDYAALAANAPTLGGRTDAERKLAGQLDDVLRQKREVDAAGVIALQDEYSRKQSYVNWVLGRYDQRASDAARELFQRDYQPKIDALNVEADEIEKRLRKLSSLPESTVEAWLRGTPEQRDRQAFGLTGTQIVLLRERLKGMPPTVDGKRALEHLDSLKYPPTVRGLRGASWLSAQEREDEWRRFHEEVKERDAQDALRRAAIAADPGFARKLEKLLEDAWVDALDRVPASARAGIRSDFDLIPTLSRKPDGSIEYVLRLQPNAALRRIQMEQALALGVQVVSRGPELVGPARYRIFERPVSSADALTQYWNLGKQIPRIPSVDLGGKGLQNSHDEALFVPGGTLLRPALGLRTVAKAASTDIATNIAFHMVLSQAAMAGELVAGREGRIGAPTTLVLAVIARGRISAARASAREQAALREELEALALQRELAAKQLAETSTAARLSAPEAAQIAKVQSALEQEAKVLREAASTVTRANVNNARHLVEASEGRAFVYRDPTGKTTGTTTGHARDHIPLKGQDARTLAQSRPEAATTTVFKTEADGLRAVRDVMRQHQTKIDALLPGQVIDSKVLGTFRLPTPMPGFNSIKGGTPRAMDIEEVSFAIGRLPNGELQLIHFSPRVGPK
jgi:hypothetical protein